MLWNYLCEIFAHCSLFCHKVATCSCLYIYIYIYIYTSWSKCAKFTFYFSQTWNICLKLAWHSEGNSVFDTATIYVCSTQSLPFLSVCFLRMIYAVSLMTFPEHIRHGLHNSSCLLSSWHYLGFTLLFFCMFHTGIRSLPTLRGKDEEHLHCPSAPAQLSWETEIWQWHAV